MNNEELKVVLDQISAHNQHDLPGQKAFFSDDCQWVRDDGTVILDHMDNFIEKYGALVKRSPNLHIEVTKNMTLGEVVMIEEYVSGLVNHDFVEIPPYYCLVAYRVQNKKIISMTVYPAKLT